MLPKYNFVLTVLAGLIPGLILLLVSASPVYVATIALVCSVVAWILLNILGPEEAVPPAPDPIPTASERTELRKLASVKFAVAFEKLRESCWELLKDPDRYWMFDAVSDIREIFSFDVILDAMIETIDNDKLRELVGTKIVEPCDIASLSRLAISRLPLSMILLRHLKEYGYSDNWGMLTFELERTLFLTEAFKRWCPSNVTRDAVRDILEEYAPSQVLNGWISLREKLELTGTILKPSHVVRRGWIVSLELWLRGESTLPEFERPIR